MVPFWASLFLLPVLFYFAHWAVSLLIVVVVVTVRSFWVLPIWWKKKQTPKEALRKTKAHLLAVFGSGGHTSEMCTLLNSLSPSRFSRWSFLVASSDSRSIPYAEKCLKKDITEDADYSWIRIPRSRSVKQSLLSSVWTTIWSTFYVCAVTYPKLKPDIVIVNGPGTCVPVVLAAYVYRFFFGRDCVRIVFVESLCRVKKLSVTGHIMQLFADRFVVQWEGLAQETARAEYHGRIC